VSDTGLHAGLYEYARVLADLVDSVLVEVKTKPTGPISAERRRLGDILLASTSKHWSDMSSRLLALTLEDMPEFKPKDWRDVGRALLSESVDGGLTARLERLAQVLEREQLDAASRIRD